jgi:hypothetical protein
VHDEVGSFKVEGLALDIAADHSGGPSDGDVYTAVFPASTVLKLSPTGEPLATITGTETPAGSLGFVNFGTFAFSGVAIDSSGALNSGDLYVADIEHKVVDRFDETGKFICQITATTPISAEEQDDECNGAAGSATTAGGFEPTAATVNAAGDLFVADAAHQTIDEFGPKGGFIEEIVGPDITNPAKLAIAPSGALYIVNGGNLFSGGTNVVKDSGGTFTVLDSNEPRGVAVDPTTEYLYIQHNNAEGAGAGRIDEYDPTGLPLGTFISASEEAHNAGTLAVGAAGQVYDAARESVTIFGPDIAVPTVMVAGASAIKETTVTFHGEVTPDTAHGGTEVTNCEFEYVTQAQFEVTQFASPATAECAPATPYAAAQSVSADISGLVPATTYHYRLAAANAGNRVSRSETPVEVTFATQGPPTIEAETTSATTRSEATLEAQINPNGHDTNYEFQYGPTDSYGENAPVPAADIGEGQEPVQVSQQIASLTIGTIYHYRVIAENSSGTTPGADHTFTTVPVAGIQTQLVQAGPHTATIKARIDPEMGLPPLNGTTTCAFQYVTEADFAATGFSAPSTAPCTPASIVSASEGQNVIIQLSGLAVDTIYDFRFLTANEAGEVAHAGSFATFGLHPPFETGMFDIGGAPYTQAGGHPYELTTNIGFNSTTNDTYSYSPASGRLKDVRVELPMGLSGNPTATAKCTALAAAESKDNPGKCAPGAQIGVMHITIEAGENPGLGPLQGSSIDHVVPLFNVVPAKGAAAEFASGTINAGLGATIEARVRTGEGYGVSADTLNIPTIGTVRKVSVSIWGVPADPAHNSQRICPPGETGTASGFDGYVVGCGSGEPLKAFLRSPTSCPGQNLTTNVLADSYNAPGEFVEAHAEMPGMTGCTALRFSPRISVIPESNSADSPTGLRVDLHVPSEENPNGLTQADLKDATVTLPAGIRTNPSSANGLVGCSEAQIELAGPDPATCPDASKVGSVEIDTPLIDHPLRGGVYVAQQGNADAAQGSNPFDSLLALYIAVNDPQTGVVVKLAGKVSVDPASGQLTTTFAENPQLPFEDLKLAFFGGPNAALSTPALCGSYTTNSALTPWSGGAPVRSASSFAISSGADGGACANSEAEEPNHPSFSAGTEKPLAGAFSPFVLHLHREDGSQNFAALNVTLPPGLIGKLAGVGECPDSALAAAATKTGAAEQSNPSCPAATRLGSVNSSLGSGPAPYYATGSAYLAGPYKSAPLSVAIITPAVAGPFDLGTVVVRSALHINPETAQVSVKSDPIPTELDGIQLDIRSIDVNLDRPDFTLNPTNCERMAVTGEEVSSLGNSAPLSNPFQVGECAKLAFKPRLALSLKGKTKRTGHPALRAALTYPKGNYANIAKAQVTLPHSEFLDQAHIGTVCTRVQFNARNGGGEQCPPASIYGHARAITPLLDQPIEGPVFLRSSNHKLPDLVAALGGQISVDLAGKVDTGKNGGIRNTFEVVPDAPVSKFTLSLKGGSKGLLINSENVCRKPQHAIADFTGQNGKVSDTTPLIANDCGKARKHKRHGGKR